MNEEVVAAITSELAFQSVEPSDNPRLRGVARAIVRRIHVAGWTFKRITDMASVGEGEQQ